MPMDPRYAAPPPLDYRTVPDRDLAMQAQQGNPDAQMELQRRGMSPSMAMIRPPATSPQMQALQAQQPEMPPPSPTGMQQFMDNYGARLVQHIPGLSSMFPVHGQAPATGPMPKHRSAQEVTPEMASEGRLAVAGSRIQKGIDSFLAAIGGGGDQGATDLSAYALPAAGSADLAGVMPQAGGGVPPQVAAAMAQRGAPQSAAMIAPPVPGPNPMHAQGPMPAPQAAPTAAPQPQGGFNMTPEQSNMLMRFGLNLMAASGPQSGPFGLQRTPGLGEAIGKAGAKTLEATDKLTLAQRKLDARAAEKEADRQVQRERNEIFRQNKLSDDAWRRYKAIIDTDEKSKDRAVRSEGNTIRRAQAGATIMKEFDALIMNAGPEEAARLKVQRDRLLGDINVDPSQIRKAVDPKTGKEIYFDMSSGKPREIR